MISIICIPTAFIHSGSANIAQSKVLESVYAEKCTVVMVAHRLSTVRNCDRIVLLKNGRIAEEGIYDELMDLKGDFYELMRRQSN